MYLRHMCYQFKQTKSRGEVEERFQAEFKGVENYTPTVYNAFTHPHCAVITNNKPRQLQLFSWGVDSALGQRFKHCQIHPQRSNRNAAWKAVIQKFNQKQMYYSGYRFLRVATPRCQRKKQKKVRVAYQWGGTLRLCRFVEWKRESRDGWNSTNVYHNHHRREWTNEQNSQHQKTYADYFITGNRAGLAARWRLCFGEWLHNCSINFGIFCGVLAKILSSVSPHRRILVLTKNKKM